MEKITEYIPSIFDQWNADLGARQIKLEAELMRINVMSPVQRLDHITSKDPEYLKSVAESNLLFTEWQVKRNRRAGILGKIFGIFTK